MNEATKEIVLNQIYNIEKCLPEIGFPNYYLDLWGGNPKNIAASSNRTESPIYVPKLLWIIAN